MCGRFLSTFHRNLSRVGTQSDLKLPVTRFELMTSDSPTLIAPRMEFRGVTRFKSCSGIPPGRWDSISSQSCGDPEETYFAYVGDETPTSPGSVKHRPVSGKRSHGRARSVTREALGARNQSWKRPTSHPGLLQVWQDQSSVVVRCKLYS